MGISVFPSGGGEFITNDFVVDMDNTENNVIDLGRSYASGSYDISLASGDSSFDIYALDADGASVGYTNNATLITTDAFTSLVILGVATDEKITFAFSGASNNATSEGNAVGAGAYLESINPSDLPTIDDTANVIGGNFASDVEIYFESGTVSIEAKQVARADSTALIITRPDNLDAALDPWDVKAINPGITPPTGSNAHILAGTVDAGAVPIWTTTSPLPNAYPGQAYSATLVATDPDGGSIDYAITAGSLPTGLSFNGTTGVISGTATGDSQTFTVTASDPGGNENPREFALSVLAATGGIVSTFGNYTYHQFESTDDFELFTAKDIEYLIVAGGGGGGAGNTNTGGGGGGAGGFRISFANANTGAGNAGTVESALSLTPGTYTATVGAGGAAGSLGFTPANGSSSSFSNISTVGGGAGAGDGTAAGNGGSGGGGSNSSNSDAGSGTSTQGFDGGQTNVNQSGGGGGGAAGAGGSPNNRFVGGAAGAGYFTPIPLSEFWAVGGQGGCDIDEGGKGTTANGFGSGGGGGASPNFSTSTADGGRAGVVVLRYE